MKKLLAYECKRILLPLCIFTAVAAVIYVAAAFSADLIDRWALDFNEATGVPVPGDRAGDTVLYVPAIILAALCTAVPVMQFSYRMKKRSVDLWYALPVTRRALTFVRFAGGLALVLVPYAVSYWAGFAVIACRDNLFHLQYYVALFFASLPAAALLLGTNAFLFTRANRVGDGIFFLLAWAFLLAMQAQYFNYFSFRGMPSALENLTNYSTYSPLVWLFIGFDCGARTGSVSFQDPAVVFPLWAALGAAALFGLFYTAKGHPAENAGQISDTWFGYRTIIPVYLFCTMSWAFASSASVSAAAEVAALVLVAAAGLVAYFAYRRSFRLRLCDVLSLVLSLGAGTLVSAITLAYL